MSFDFKQTVDGKMEEGTCTIQYPKKIYCNYNNFNDGIQASIIIISYLIVLYGGILFFIYNFLYEIGFIEFLNTLT